ncbi:MAG: MBL fold metallo-hydrolase [Novosphingobium sp.]|nr:MBL fold metallo-hydrolase [Novosphingobium sp.]
MKLIMLGSGTSTGVPKVGNDWGLCDPAEPRNRRSRVSIVVESGDGGRILVDTATDLRSQLLDNAIDRIDAVFWTHDHADHCHGIDDLRPIRQARQGPIPGYAAAETVHRLRNRFGYVFAGQHGYPSIVALENLDRVRICAGIGVGHLQMPHGPGQSTGYRFDAAGKSIGYATDFSEVTEAMVGFFAGCDLFVLDALRREPHPTHAHLEMALDFIGRTRPRRAILTHLDKSMDYAMLRAELPANVQPGYDGLKVTL